MDEKKKIIVCFKGSGVKTLSFSGYLLLSIGIIAIVIAIIGLLMFFSNQNRLWGEKEAIEGLALLYAFLPVSVVSIAGGAICLGLKNIARTALYQRTILEEQYHFEEPKPLY